jgi:AraC-like DNA-binding protein
MKADVFYERMVRESEYGISFIEVDVPFLDVPWHYHPETEIIYVEQSTGTRFVGDHSEPFKEGDVGMIGANLPHVWKSDAVYLKSIPELRAKVIVVHFREEVFTGSLSALPEMRNIKQLIHESQFGIKFTGASRTRIISLMKEIIQSSGVDKLTRLIGLLDYMAQTTDKELLATTGYTKIRKSADFDRFDKVHRYMIENFERKITLETVASLIGMTPTSFCRYFKKHTKKPFHTILNEFRVGHACKLLIENRLSIAGVCFECGFNNISNFNEQFKKIKGLTPSQYIKKWQHG